ncbi:SDR family oxidoreductase [Curtobacterium sp. VKM Ac-1395]|uniref:SDR family oxidoreductase n=1 Tax=Curtobacterium sp. VKM Ac-1395 TaxID=2783815 RepID=UPI00188B5EB5|nr:SDR family oxidoreductase [Curtobacterium sp. VKM Ac-1395]MBF4591955.1 SDR family oxidoreductase [Curtobacterium sp. VKM Ac-1395]
MTGLSGQTVLVTGANGGLGTEFVRQALERGATKVYAAARRPQDWDDARIVPLVLDVSDEASVARAAAEAPDVTIVVNNAGLLRPGGLVDGDLGDVRAQIETNLVGPLLVTRAFAPALRVAQGAVVNVASVLSWLGGSGAYGVSKAGLWSATDSIRLELASDGVQVLGAYLGYTDTAMATGVDAPKNTPEAVVTAIWDGVEHGEHEVLADELTRSVRASLGASVAERYAALAG